MPFMLNASTSRQALKHGRTGLLLMSAMIALSSIATVCVTSGGIATVRSDTIEITNGIVTKCEPLTTEDIVGDFKRSMDVFRNFKDGKGQALHEAKP